MPKPAGWTWEQAAALPLVGLTTFRALFRRSRLSAGESVLVLGARGGVATMAVTLAVAAGKFDLLGTAMGSLRDFAGLLELITQP